MLTFICSAITLLVGFAGGWFARGNNQKSADTINQVVTDIKDATKK